MDNVKSFTGKPNVMETPGQKWYESFADYYISMSRFNGKTGSGGKSRKETMGILYDVYNNKFPKNWFDHITNPLSAKKEAHKRFPAKIKPINILRTNIDLLLGEYPRRPYVYQVVNLGDTGYNRYTEQLKERAKETLNAYFIRAAIQAKQENGEQITKEELIKLQQNPPLPEEVKKEFASTYKDAIAVKAQKWLNKTVATKRIRFKSLEGFKDWVIAGESYTYKNIENDALVYRRISPLHFDYIPSTLSAYAEDAEACIYRDFWTVSDIVSNFYLDLTPSQVKELELAQNTSVHTGFYRHLIDKSNDLSEGKLEVCHVQFMAKRKIGFRKYVSEDTWEIEEDVVSEDYKALPGETVTWRMINVGHEVWKIGQDLYLRGREIPVQRQQHDNRAVCKLSYNGCKYSDTHSENISVMELGMPLLATYVIIDYIIEKTIAKSRGKILLIDKNTIPNNSEEDWDEEKFFYYGEAMGYALIDRNQDGVDKTWNQYQVVDMSMYDQIAQLINLKEQVKQDWDDLLGVSRQRKGQTYSSDGQGVNERAVFQSTVITDQIFNTYEEFQELELRGLLDLGKYLTAKGENSMYLQDDSTVSMLSLLPEDLVNEGLDVVLISASEEIKKLKEMRSFAQAMLQNAQKPSTVAEVVDSTNMAELKQKLKRIEEIQVEIDRTLAADEQDAIAAADERAKDMEEFRELLAKVTMNEEYDRKEDIEHIRGTYNTFTFQNGDANANGVPDGTEVQKILLERDKFYADLQDKRQKRNKEAEDLKLKAIELSHKMKMDKVNAGLKSRQINAQAKKKKSK